MTAPLNIMDFNSFARIRQALGQILEAKNSVGDNADLNAVVYDPESTQSVVGDRACPDWMHDTYGSPAGCESMGRSPLTDGEIQVVLSRLFANEMKTRPVSVKVEDVVKSLQTVADAWSDGLYGAVIVYVVRAMTAHVQDVSTLYNECLYDAIHYEQDQDLDVLEVLDEIGRAQTWRMLAGGNSAADDREIAMTGARYIICLAVSRMVACTDDFGGRLLSV
jgi:hypothetical protein